MKRVLTAVILIPLVVIALFRAPPWLFSLLVLGVALLAAKEYLDIAKVSGLRPFEGLSYLFVTCGILSLFATVTKVGLDTAASYGRGASIVGNVALVLMLASPFILMAASLHRDSLSRSLADAAVSFLLIPYVSLTLATLVILQHNDSGAFFLLYLMLIVWTGDIAALYVGRAIGKHKLAPRISPGKTWEGAIASTIGAISIALLLSRYSQSIHSGFARVGLAQQTYPLYAAVQGSTTHSQQFPALVVVVVAFALCVNVAAQLGDLFESAIKRGAGLKDSGNILPGHGGVLDRIDALLFALPVGLCFYTIMH